MVYCCEVRLQVIDQVVEIVGDGMMVEGILKHQFGNAGAFPINAL